MLAATPGSLKEIEEKIKKHGHLLGSTKFDGIRAMVRDGVLLSRRLTPIRNKVLQKRFGRIEFEGQDGELILPLSIGDFHLTSGQCRSADDPAIGMTFQVFDNFEFPKWTFEDRLDRALETCQEANLEGLEGVTHTAIYTLDEFLTFETGALTLGHEGVCLRRSDGPYKAGRSTMNEAWLMKVKRFTDAEAKIIGFEEQMKNNNAATVDELGKTKRTKHKENMVGKGTLGALLCVGTNGKFKGVEFKIAGGARGSKEPMDDKLRKEIWENQRKYKGRIITYKFFDPGTVDAPRHAGFKGFRPGGI